MASRTPPLAAAIVVVALTSPGAAAPLSPQAAAAPPPASAQTPQSPVLPAASNSFEESIEVTVVNVDVVVRDKSGKQVAGLTRDDFTLFVDGKKAEISNFSGELPAGGGKQPATATAPGSSAGPAAPPEAAPKRERLNLVVYVDNANLRPFDRNRLIKQLRAFLQKTLGPDDQVLVVTHDLGLQVRHPFREALSALGPELDKMEKESAAGLSRDIDRRHTMDTMQDIVRTNGCANGADQASGLARAHAESVLAEVKVTYANLHHMLRSLGGLDGRKALIYVGDGVPTQVGTDVFGMLEELCPQNVAHFGSEPVNAMAPMRQVIADANANLVTLYTLEATGVQSYASAEHAGRPSVSFELARRIDADRQDSLVSLARETGGRAALNGSDFSHDLAEIAAELNGSYSLGFVPARAGEGRTHEIRVEANRPGLRVSYRASYRDRTPAERLEGQVEAALIHGQADNPLGASLKLGKAAPSEHGRVLVPVQVRVPFGKLAYVPQQDGRHGHVSIVVGNIDARGGMAPIQKMHLPLRIPEADSKRVLASQMGYDVKLLLEPGRQRLAFAVRDDVARISSSLVQEIDVGKNGTASAMVAGGGIPNPN